MNTARNKKNVPTGNALCPSRILAHPAPPQDTPRDSPRCAPGRPSFRAYDCSPPQTPSPPSKHIHCLLLNDYFIHCTSRLRRKDCGNIAEMQNLRRTDHEKCCI